MVLFWYSVDRRRISDRRRSPCTVFLESLAEDPVRCLLGKDLQKCSRGRHISDRVTSARVIGPKRPSTPRFLSSREISSAARSHCARFARSRGEIGTRFGISQWPSSSASDTFRVVAKTRDPLAERVRAISRPIPEEQPVTTTALWARGRDSGEFIVLAICVAETEIATLDESVFV